MTQAITTTSPARKWGRIVLAGPVSIVAALVVMAGMTRWMPAGAAGIDNVVLPLVLAPLIWAALFFYACLDRNLLRAAAVTVGLILVNAVLVAGAFLDRPVATETVR